MSAVLLCSVSAAGAAVGSRFYLESPTTGGRVGPFVLADGEIVRVGGQEYRIVTEAQTALERKMAQLVLPAFEMEKATLRDVLHYLRLRTTELAPDGRGVDFVFGQTVKAGDRRANRGVVLAR